VRRREEEGRTKGACEIEQVSLRSERAHGEWAKSNKEERKTRVEAIWSQLKEG
jgi:hypothetical protein